MNKTRTKKRRLTKRRLTKRKGITKRKGGNKPKGCKTKCKAMFASEVKQDKKYKAINKIASFFGKQKYVEEELNKVLDDKDIQNDPVFKECVKDCNK